MTVTQHVGTMAEVDTSIKKDTHARGINAIRLQDALGDDAMRWGGVGCDCGGVSVQSRQHHQRTTVQWGEWKIHGEKKRKRGKDGWMHFSWGKERERTQGEPVPLGFEKRGKGAMTRGKEGGRKRGEEEEEARDEPMASSQDGGAKLQSARPSPGKCEEGGWGGHV